MQKILEVLVKFRGWYFSTPTPLIATVSLIVAYAAYLFQHEEKRKYNAYLIAERYSNNLLPRMRVITAVLNYIGALDYCNFFIDPVKFNNSELVCFLEKHNKNPSNFRDLFYKIDNEILYDASLYCASEKVLKEVQLAIYSLNQYDENIIKEKYAIWFEKYFKNMLNDFEAICLSLCYNLTDEAILYQSLSHTFLPSIPKWYFFLSENNHNDETMFYTNIILLYERWNKRKLKLNKKASKRKLSSIFTGKKVRE